MYVTYTYHHTYISITSYLFRFNAIYYLSACAFRHLHVYIFRTSSWSVVKLLFIGFLCSIASIVILSEPQELYEPTAVKPASTSFTPHPYNQLHKTEHHRLSEVLRFSKEEAKHKQHEKKYAHFHPYHPKNYRQAGSQTLYINTIRILKRFLIIVKSCYRDNKRSCNLLWWKDKEKKNDYNYIAMLRTIYICSYLYLRLQCI